MYNVITDLPAWGVKLDLSWVLYDSINFDLYLSCSGKDREILQNLKGDFTELYSWLVELV